MENRKFSIDYDGNKYEVATKFRKKGSELLLLLHGLGCSKDSFQDIWFRDELSDYSLMAFNFIGFGDSSKTESFSYEMEDQASICAEVVKKIFSKKIHIIAHSMRGAIGLLLPPDILDSAITFANLEGNLSREDCDIVSRKTLSVSFQNFENEMLPELKELSKSFGERCFFLDSALPSGFYKSAESLVRWSDSGELISRFKNLPKRLAENPPIELGKPKMTVSGDKAEVKIYMIRGNFNALVIFNMKFENNCQFSRLECCFLLSIYTLDIPKNILYPKLIIIDFDNFRIAAYGKFA